MNANVTKTPYYKERVEKIEKEILVITNNATYTVFSGDDAAYLLTLLTISKQKEKKPKLFLSIRNPHSYSPLRVHYGK